MCGVLNVQTEIKINTIGNEVSVDVVQRVNANPKKREILLLVGKRCVVKMKHFHTHQCLLSFVFKFPNSIPVR